jgi:hypothetical protein
VSLELQVVQVAGQPIVLVIRCTEIVGHQLTNRESFFSVGLCPLGAPVASWTSTVECLRSEPIIRNHRVRFVAQLLTLQNKNLDHIICYLLAILDID